MVMPLPFDEFEKRRADFTKLYEKLSAALDTYEEAAPLELCEDEVRTVACAYCGGDKGHFEGGNERWIRCTACDGEGEFEVELKPVDLEDLENRADDETPSAL